MKTRVLLSAELSLVLGLSLVAVAFAQQSTTPPPESLVVQGVPPISTELVEAVGRYGNYRNATLLDWEPAARSILISTRFANTAQLHLVGAPGAERRQLTFFNDAVARARFHPSGADYIVFAKDVGGGEWYQLYRYDMATANVTLLTDGKSRNIFGAFANNGDMLAYTSTRRTGRDTDLWLMNPANSASDHLLTQLSGGGWQPLDWSPDDSKILLLEQVSINESYLWLVDSRTGDRTELTPRNEDKEKASYSFGQFSRDGSGVYVSTDKGSEFLRLAYIALGSKDHHYLTSDHPWDVETFDVSRDGKHVAVVLNENGESALYDLATKTNTMTRLPNVPKGVISNAQWDRSSQELAFTLGSAQQLYDVFSYDTRTGSVVRWTDSESAVPTKDFQPAELVKWKSFDGREISGYLYKPPPRFAGRRPVLVLIHGGPEAQARPEWLGRLNYLLNELGIAIVAPNVRGSTGYGKSFSLLDNGYLREGAYKDIAALFDWIGKQATLDAGRIAVMGGSYGGHMTLAVSTFYSERIRCSIDVVGMSNLVTFLEHTEGYRQDLRRVEYGDERDPKMRAFLERIAPMNNIGKIRKPMLVVAGKNDPRVPVSESNQIVEALEKQGTPVWYIMAKDEGHGLVREPNRDFQGYAIVEFLQQFLLK
jgi:dipeptidyl aminopeptidase/acylaminoacyl peptidase